MKILFLISSLLIAQSGFCQRTHFHGPETSYKQTGSDKKALTVVNRRNHYPSALDLKNANSIREKKINEQDIILPRATNPGEVNPLLSNEHETLVRQLKLIKVKEDNNNLSGIVQNYLEASKSLERLGDYKSALEFQKKALWAYSSVTTAENSRILPAFFSKFQYLKEEEMIASQRNEIIQQKKVQSLEGGILALLIIFIIFGIITYRARTRRNLLLETKNEENELLLKEIHHRVKNNLEVVSSLLALQSARSDDLNTRNAMKESQNRVRAIGMVHQKLYQGENSETIEMRDYFLDLGENILDSFGAVGKVKLALPMERLELNLETAVPLGLIVNELILNILKYAFPPGQIGNIWIRLEKRINDILHLEVSDDGIGKSGHTKGTGFGSQLISLLTRQLGGMMHEESKDGTRIYFDFKMNKMSQKSICKV